MKKLLSIILVALMIIALLASCSKPVNTDTDSQGEEKAEVNNGLTLPNMTIVNKVK